MRAFRRIVLLTAVLLAGWVVWKATRPFRGYTDLVSYAPGDTVTAFFEDGLWMHSRTVRLFDATGNVVDSAAARVGPQRTAEQPWRSGFGWRPSTRYGRVLPSGVYLWENVIPFVVRPTPGHADMLIVYPSNTIAAYSQVGGRSLYVMNKYARMREAARRFVTGRWGDLLPDAYAERARTVSFRQPMGRDHWEFFAPFLAWAKTTLPDAGYVSDADLDHADVLRGVRLLVIVGHSEYWTRRARRNVDAFVARGGRMAVLSGNTMWWQVRYDAAGNLVCFKTDPDAEVPDSLMTVNWDDARLDYPIEQSLGAAFPHGGFGRDEDDGWDGFRIIDTTPLMEGIPVPSDSIFDVATTEFDGAPLLRGREQGTPVADTAALGFYRFRLLGYDRGQRFGAPTVGTMHVFQKTPSGGTVFQVGSTDWCGAGFTGPDSTYVKDFTAQVLRRMREGNDLW